MSQFYKFIIFIFGVLISISATAQAKVGIIKDSDGFVNVRIGAGIEFPVLAKIDEDDLFYIVNQENSQWQQIRIFKEKQIIGFIHKSRIQNFESLPDQKQTELVIKTLRRQRHLAEQFNKTVDSENQNIYLEAGNRLEGYSESQYDGILSVLTTYFCRTKDQEVLREFSLTASANKNSANENVSYALGECFICDSELVIREIGKLENSQIRTHIYNQIEWGLLNVFDSEGKEFLKFKSLLDKGRMNTKSR
ncbi:MAG: hypothetical protein ACOH1O_10220 [Flavobacterium sp.]